MTEEKAIKRAMSSIESQVRDIYYQGYKNGRKEAVKKVVCKEKYNTMEGYLDESRNLVFLSYVTVEGLCQLGYDIISTDEEGSDEMKAEIKKVILGLAEATKKEEGAEDEKDC